MGRSVQDLIDGLKINIDLSATEIRIPGKNLTSLKGIEKFTKLKGFECSYNLLETLEGIEKLVDLEVLYCDNNKLTSLKGIENLIKLTKLRCEKNKLVSLEGIENLTNLTGLVCYDNLLNAKYDGLRDQELVQKIKLESHLKQNDDLRGAASISDTGLFDFKQK